MPQTLWWDVAPRLLSPKSVLSQQVAVLSCEIPFFLRVFWFKAQLKQTEANPLSSQQLQAGYQLRVIMMSHSSGACVWTSNMTLVCSGHLFSGTRGETQRAESRARTFGDKESACFGEFLYDSPARLSPPAQVKVVSGQAGSRSRATRFSEFFQEPSRAICT